MTALDASAKPWAAIDEAINEQEANACEGWDTLRDKIGDYIGEICRYEAERCARWVRAGGTPDETVTGIMSMEEPPR